MHVYHYAPYERTALKPPDGRARHARGRARRPPPRRGARRPLPRHAAGAPRLGAELLDQGGRGALRVRAARPRSRAAASRSSLRGAGSRSASDVAARRDPRLQRGGLPSRSTSCTAGCSSSGRPSCRGAPPPEAREPKEETQERLDEREARARTSCSTARRRASRAGCSRSSSSTTAARRSRSGGSTSTTCTLDEEELIEDGDTIGGLELVGEPVPDKQSLVYTFRFPPQEHKIGGDVRRPGDREGLRRRGRRRARASSRCGAAKKRADEPLPRALIPPSRSATTMQRDAVLRFAQDYLRAAYPALVDDPRAAAAARAARRHAGRGGAQPRRQLPLRPGPARLGQDLERRADGDRADAGGPARRRSPRSATRRSTSSSRTSRTPRSRPASRSRAGRSASGEDDALRGTSSSSAPTTNDDMLDAELQLIAGTSWLFSREELDQHVDTLFVDEGGQFALADALAVGTAARNLDPARRPEPAAAGLAGLAPAGRGRVGARAPARRRRDGAAGHGPLPRAARGGCGPR